MPFVVDASVTLAWFMQDENDARADRALERLRRDSALVPPIWPLEVANALAVAERRGRATSSDVARITDVLSGYPIEVEEASFGRAFGPVLNVAREHGLSVYDASHLELAMREGLPLATLDVRLRDVATRAGVQVVT